MFRDGKKIREPRSFFKKWKNRKISIRKIVIKTILICGEPPVYCLEGKCYNNCDIISLIVKGDSKFRKKK